VIASPEGPTCVATQAVAEEIARHLPRLAAKRGLDEALLLSAFRVMPVEWKPSGDYDGKRAQAEQRMDDRDPDDWPTVALALELGLPVWSQDKDFADAGVEVFTTRQLLDMLRESKLDGGTTAID
jgi:predicted nucleic acid-binding protein